MVSILKYSSLHKTFLLLIFVIIYKTWKRKFFSALQIL